MKKKPISVSKDELNEELFQDVLFFKFAEGGAMGEPGGVVWVKANGESYHCNYCYGDVKYEDLLKLFAPLKTNLTLLMTFPFLLLQNSLTFSP